MSHSTLFSLSGLLGLDMPVLPEDQNTTRILLADPIAAKVLNKVFHTAYLFVVSSHFNSKRTKPASQYGMMKTLARFTKAFLI
jgi:hypothetical protein